MKIRNQPYLFPALIILVFLVSYSYTFDRKLAPLGDNASYYMLGEALAQGEGYVNISKIDKTPNNHYPPGYPAVLSIFMQFTDSIVFFKILNGVFLLASCLILYQVMKKLLENDVLAFIIVLMTVLNFHILQYGSMIMSEIPFLFFSLLGLWLFLKIDTQKPFFRDRNFYLLLVAIVISYHTRSLGIALTGATIAAFLLQKKWGHGVALGGGFVLLALPWFVRSQMLGGGSYSRQLMMINPYQPNLGKADVGDFIDRFLNNFSRYITTEIPNALFPFTEVDYRQEAAASDWVAGLLLMAVIIYGFITLRKFRIILGLYALFTFFILLLWPDVWVGVRFMVPLIPILAVGLVHGLYQLAGKLFSAAGKKVSGWAFLILPLLLLTSVGQLHKQASTPLHPAWDNYYAMGRWLRSQSGEKPVVACGKPALFYLYSKTFTVRYPFEQDTEALLAELEDEKVDYVVIDQVYPNTFRYLLPAVRAHPERFEQVFHQPNPDTFLLKFKR